VPKYVIHNPTPCLVQIPGTSIFVKPRANLTLDVQPGVLATDGMQTLLAGGHLRMRTVVESPLINDHIEEVVVDMLGSVTGGDVGWDRIGIVLGATADKRVYTTPEFFRHTVDELSIEVFHQGGGRRLEFSKTGNPKDGDYVLEESGGLGTGYDTVRVIAFTPHGLLANYRTL
jgi:hypothetical protein